MKRSLLVVMAIIGLSGCGGSPSAKPQARAAEPAGVAPTAAPAGLAIPRLHLPDGKAIDLEVADDAETRAQGLMFRDRLRPGTGMLFVFPSNDIYAFWMKNTFIPLDMIWIDEKGTIVDIKTAVPPCPADPCPSYAPSGISRYVLELASGQAAEYGLRTGMVVKFENVRPELAR